MKLLISCSLTWWIQGLSITCGMKFKDFQAPTLFSSTSKALNLGEKNSSNFNDFQGCVGTLCIWNKKSLQPSSKWSSLALFSNDESSNERDRTTCFSACSNTASLNAGHSSRSRAALGIMARNSSRTFTNIGNWHIFMAPSTRISTESQPRWYYTAATFKYYQQSQKITE